MISFCPFYNSETLITSFNMTMQDVTWLVFVKTFGTRITSVFFLDRHYHRICHQLNIYGMNSVDVFATVKIHRKHYRSCATHLCTSGTTSLKPLSNDWLVLWVGDGHTRWTPQAFILCKSLHFLFSITDWSLKLVSDTRSGLEPTIYRPQGEHTNHYTTDAVDWSLRFVGKIHFP
jgi:hypothetical protein